MSADQPSSSFGDPNAQPPTPKRTPTATVLPSPVFETPKNNQGRLDEQSGWTPRFAEEFSMFSATPGNLRGSQTPFPDFGPATPYCGSVIRERPSFGEANAIRVNEFAPSSGLHLPPAESSQILKSSPTFDRPSAADQLPASVGASVKKARRGTLAREPQGQTATPPPSARKVERKLAPKLDNPAMQNDEDFSQQAHFVAAAHQQVMGSFVTSQGDMFGYPLSAPAAAPAFGNQQSFWDSDPGLAGMDIDFGPNGGNVFQPPTPHQVADAVGWAGTNQMLQSQANGGGHGEGHVPTGDHQSALVSQPAMSMVATSSAEHSMFAVSYPTPMEDPFGVDDDGGAVNPGLLFSRPQSASMDMTSFNHLMPAPSPSVGAASQGGQTDSRGPSVPKAAGRNELRRSASAKDVTPSKQDRTSTSSPVKSAGRPGLSRSLSENRGRKAIGRPSLPTLAPRPQSQLVYNAGVSANRPIVSQAPRPSGRSSPPKSSHRHHHRLSSLSSIPEASKPPQMRTQATLKIDANGRARVEAVVVVDERSPSAQTRPSSYSVARRRQLDSSEDDDPSSTDEEPIIIPSRNTSFALPDPRKPTTVHPFHSSQRSISARSSTSYSTVQGGYQDGGDSDGETIVNEPTPASKVSGDAASELQKLRETRQRQRSVPQQKRFLGSYSGYPASSPTTLSETSLPTPTADLRRRDVRCVCNRAEADPKDFLVQCESCEMFVHGRCVNISQRTMPGVYICAFCANTPNLRGGRLRDKGRVSGTIGPPGSASSPLAHKSLKSFR